MQVVVLYVDQEESVRRQMARAKMAALHNLRARDAGTEDLMRQLRSTDVDEAKCRGRYAVFKEHYGTLLRLKQVCMLSLPLKCAFLQNRDAVARIVYTEAKSRWCKRIGPQC